MSKIAFYLRTKELMERLKRDFRLACGLDPVTGLRDPNNDKYGMEVRFHKVATENHGSPILLLFTMQYGFKGDGDILSATSKEAGHYFARAVNENMAAIARRAVDLAVLDANEARLAARAEAEEVLAAT